MCRISLQENAFTRIGKSNGLFHRPRPPTPCHSAPAGARAWRRPAPLAPPTLASTPTRACPRRPAPPGTTPHRRARTGRVAGAAWRGVAGWNLHGQLRVSSCALSRCVVRAAGGDPASAAAPAAGGTRPYPAHRPSAWQPSCRMSVCHCATQSCSSMGSNRRKPTWKRFQKLVCGSVRYTTSVLFSCATHSISPSASSRNR